MLIVGIIIIVFIAAVYYYHRLMTLLSYFCSLCVNGLRYLHIGFYWLTNCYDTFKTVMLSQCVVVNHIIFVEFAISLVRLFLWSIFFCLSERIFSLFFIICLCATDIEY